MDGQKEHNIPGNDEISGECCTERLAKILEGLKKTKRSEGNEKYESFWRGGRTRRLRAIGLTFTVLVRARPRTYLLASILSFSSAVCRRIHHRAVLLCSEQRTSMPFNNDAIHLQHWKHTMKDSRTKHHNLHLLQAFLLSPT